MRLADFQAATFREQEKAEMRWLFVTIIVVLLALPVFGWVIPSYFEAKTFERLTGKQVTTWDAMWVELRVQEPTK